MINLNKNVSLFDLTSCLFLPLTWHRVLPVEADCGWGRGLHVPPDGQRKTGGANSQTYTSHLVPLQEKQRALHHKQGELEMGLLGGSILYLLVSVDWMRWFSFPLRVSAKWLMHLSTWAAECWRRNWTVCLLHCISRYTWVSHQHQCCSLDLKGICWWMYPNNTLFAENLNLVAIYEQEFSLKILK